MLCGSGCCFSLAEEATVSSGWEVPRERESGLVVASGRAGRGAPVRVCGSVEGVRAGRGRARVNGRCQNEDAVEMGTRCQKRVILLPAWREQ